jgi:hypothetical protein
LDISNAVTAYSNVAQGVTYVHDILFFTVLCR